MRIVFLLFTVAVLFLGGCRVKDVREMTISLPGVQSEADLQKIRASLGSMVGVDQTSLRFDLAKKVLSLKYDSMIIAHKNIEITIAEAGYQANEIAPAPPAK